MPDESTTLSLEEWKTYDEFCKPENLKRLLTHDTRQPWTLLSQITILADQLHRSRRIHNIHREEKGWKYHHAWLCLRHTGIRNRDGDYIVYTMRPGDVLCVQFGYDRDVFITHSPVHETICGYMLSGHHDNMVGLFIPLFDTETFMSAVRLRREQDTLLQEELLVEEVKHW